MANTLESQINHIVQSAAVEIAHAVRADISAEVSRLIGGGAGGGNSAPAKRPPGRPRKVVAVTAAPVATPAAKKPGKAHRGAKFVRRTPEQVQADNDKLLAYIKSHGGQRSEDIQKGLGMAKPNVASGLQVLRESGKVKMKGVKRAATYAAA